MESPNSLATPVQYVKGVGPKRADLLHRLGLDTVEELLYFFPMRHEDRSRILDICGAREGETATVRGKVLSAGVRTTKTGISLFQASVGGKGGVLDAVWYNQPYLRSQFTVGDEVILSGKVVRYGRLQIVNPDFEIVSGEAQKSLHLGRIVPIYHLTEGLAQKSLRNIMFGAVSRYARFLPDPLTPEIMRRQRLVDHSASVRNIHFPASQRHLEAARRRLVFEEFFLLQLALALRREERERVRHGLPQEAARDLIDQLKGVLPFELTRAQVRVMDEIRLDMAKDRPMNRLVHGDVGSGKTAVALFAALVSITRGFQAALMVPTEILAEQHYITLSRFLYPFQARVGLLVQGLHPARLAETLEDARQGNVDLIVGTHKLIQEGVGFKNLGLVIVDEQHKFGVAQRGLLPAKGRSPHSLIMTATPIPRTLALTLYGDLDVSALDEMPSGRGSVMTCWVEPAEREEIYRLMREEVERGHQVFVVYPAIEGGGPAALGDAQSGYEKLKRLFSPYGVGLIHGRMPLGEREKVLLEFRKAKVSVLVATTVIEVGIDMPLASMMVVENAERFGLSQLHQLRGRVGRAGIDSYCILIGEAKTEAGRERLNALVETQDGFQIAERDLEIRGPGEFFGTRQHGLPPLRIGSITKDMEFLESARDEARALAERDPVLADPPHAQLKALLERHYHLKQPAVEMS
ncbi:MAG: ATP-dependent DNA helicase RecG [Candidatus Omnitrophica bacterium]|nr:ATP-dependent DNA helicase RecG [Candidatus Omnitrophota bacterium]